LKKARPQIKILLPDVGLDDLVDDVEPQPHTFWCGNQNGPSRLMRARRSPWPSAS